MVVDAPSSGAAVDLNNETLNTSQNPIDSNIADTFLIVDSEKSKEERKRTIDKARIERMKAMIANASKEEDEEELDIVVIEAADLNTRKKSSADIDAHSVNSKAERVPYIARSKSISKGSRTDVDQAFGNPLEPGRKGGSVNRANKAKEGLYFDQETHLVSNEPFDDAAKMVIGIFISCASRGFFGNTQTHYPWSTDSVIAEGSSVSSTSGPSILANYNPTGLAGLRDGNRSVAQFNQPFACAVDSSDNVYVSDSGNKAIRLISNFTGLVSSLVSYNSSNAAVKLVNPKGLALDQANKILYISDICDNTIKALDLTQLTLSLLAGTQSNGGLADGSLTSALFFAPTDLVYSPTTLTLFISDTGNYVIRAINLASGSITTYAGIGNATQALLDNRDRLLSTFKNPLGMALTAAGDLLVSDSGHSSIRLINATSGTVTTITASLRTPNRLRNPTSVALEPTKSTILMTDSMSGALFRTSSNDAILTSLGSFIAPEGVCVLSTGRIVVMETGANSVKYL